MCFSYLVVYLSRTKKSAKKREDKMIPPLLSPLGDEPVRRVHSNDNSSFSQECSITTVQVPVTASRQKKNGSTTNIKVSCVSFGFKNYEGW